MTNLQKNIYKLYILYLLFLAFLLVSKTTILIYQFVYRSLFNKLYSSLTFFIHQNLFLFGKFYYIICKRRIKLVKQTTIDKLIYS